MAWRLGKSVVRGEIDNRIKGRVRGRLWLIGRERPLILELKGNCRRDIAGTLLTFTHPHAAPEENSKGLSGDQTGSTGDITASRKVRVFQVPEVEAYRMLKLGLKPPESLANSLYLEWYSARNGRIIIESAEFKVAVSDYAWRMTAAEERQQGEMNAKAAGLWVKRLGESLADSGAAEKGAVPNDDAGCDDDEKPLDEFAWERRLKESDARTDKLMRLEEKYADLPREERERAIARDMGWTLIEEYLDAKANGDVPEDEGDDPFDGLDADPLPDPATEGVDWVRDDDGHPVHPLYRKCSTIQRRMHQDCQDAGALKNDVESPLQDMLFSGHMMSAKIAGSLNTLWMGHPPEPGFIVAYLKRGLTFYNEAMLHWKKVHESGAVDAGRLRRYRDDLFSVREDMLRLMNNYREKK